MKIFYTIVLMLSAGTLCAQQNCDELKKEYAVLTKEIDRKIVELDKFEKHNEELDSLLSGQQVEIEEQKRQIQIMLAKGAESNITLQQAKQALEQYEALINELQKKVEPLTKQNEVLRKENEKLKASKGKR